MTICPKCIKESRFVCSNENCKTCREVPLDQCRVYGWRLLWWKIPVELGNFLWKATWFIHIGDKISKLYTRIAKKSKLDNVYIPLDKWWITNIGIHPSKFLFETETCPYCGYENSMNFWEDREMSEAWEEIEKRND